MTHPRSHHTPITRTHATARSNQTNDKATLTNNYEAMTKDELLEICKTKGLRVGNRPGREKLLQLIRKSEDASELQAVEENDI